MFRQEYPASSGEAFLHSGTGVFDNEQIVLRLERLPEPAGRGEFTDGEWTESETGAITLYELPEEAGYSCRNMSRLPPQLFAMHQRRHCSCSSVS